MASSTRPNRTTVVVAAAAVAVVVVVAVVIALGFGSTPAVAPGVATSATPATPAGAAPGTGADPTAAPDAAAPTNDPRFGEPVADSVARDEEAEFGDGVTATLAGVAPFTAAGAGVGEVAGPAVRVTLSVTNGSSAPVSLDTTTVNAYYGPDATPASPLTSDGSSAPFSGSLAPGATATGVYAFGIAEGAGDALVVTLGRGAGSALVVFGR
jgi:hypothetical protein